MTAELAAKTGSWDVREMIRELRELFTEAPKSRQKALDHVLGELTAQLCASGVLMEGTGCVARRLATRVEESAETHATYLHYGQRRHTFPIAPNCERRSGMPFQAAQRPDSTRVPFRSRQVFTEPEVAPIVFVADDDISVYEPLELVVRSEGWHQESFVSAREFLDRPRPNVPCCLILDVNVPGLNGIELQKQLADRQDMPIIFISNCADVPLSVQAMKAGGVEFLKKPLQHDALLPVIRDAIERSREALRLDLELKALRDCYASLTHREREVMALVVSGLLNKQVGGELGIQEITVKMHRSQVMRKMKAESLPDLVIMAARLGVRPARRH